ncbi:phosphoribosyl-AMP cyclohydrolase [Neoasaia chiangmaiensis NBRC 101099]|uniref:Phosphoribosyl-AMP cyclohydrolase n=1 Tax=Neoasaia chiangmaiensis TaxID=320497 RepID=A0A1U9KN06_9PROT|nr:phosphoribosyl-AMP cyclohydrolase [Neoasaia chiangmaiensis]AQS87177.1 phosphoribosyl-AMP cyclohydrolase [Neoasaia chiangmaiensis]GBR38237.1 phosphoribosyl-AMP cyclohydrolase [Neoasaia chiangmaiensis NBRC 101099]GEN15976.1 phosphoribosyl-AMP cyclohydrolase [Neoasaia chiangmaiensis]
MSYRPPNSASIAPILDSVRFNSDGLIAAIAQSADDGAVLMLAWMNHAALAETIATGQACYFSRSRDTLWRKGETSGQRQKIVDIRLDCDSDAVLLIVDQTGVACHTGRRSCFYKSVGPDGLQDTEAPRIAPETLYAATGP